MRVAGLSLSAVLLACGIASGQTTAGDDPVRYRLEPLPRTEAELLERFTEPQIRILEKLNRRDQEHLARADPPVPGLVVPATWEEDERRYSPLPGVYDSATSYPKLIVVDQTWQVFGAYEWGRLVRWGPVSTGRAETPTPPGLFHLTWKAKSRRSTDNQAWLLTWYFNFINARGISFHQFDLPGYPASHACVRLLERDAQWLYEWGDQWILDSREQLALPGTPVRVFDAYPYDAPPAWTGIEALGRAIELPPMPSPERREISAALERLIAREDRIEGCAVERLEGEVDYGRTFEAPIGRGLRLVLSTPAHAPEDGWTIEIVRVIGEQDGDHIYPVSPPFRFFNPRVIGPVYGMSVREALDLSRRRFNFVTTRAEQRIAWREVRKILWPNEHPPGADDRAVVRLSLLKLGRGVLTITESRVGTREVRNEPRDVVEWMKFRVDLCWP